MPGKIYTRSKIATLGALLQSAHADFKAAGFASVMPAADAPFTPGADEAGKIVLESTAAVNPVQDKQTYRIMLEVFKQGTTGTGMRAIVANPAQISNTGGYTSFPVTDDPAAVTAGQHVMGQLGARFTLGSDAAKGDVFIARNAIPRQHYDAGATMSYILAASNHGVTFYVWEDTSDAAPVFSFFSVQSPVNKDTGAPLADLSSPIFCVYACDNTGVKKFVVNEADTARPTKAVSAEVDTVNSAAIVNAEEQVAIKRGNRYLVTFPNRLNTERYAYTEELDMIAYTSADVIGENTEIPVRIYGETTDRIYRALKANGPNNTKMRLLMLIEGGGIPTA